MFDLLKKKLASFKEKLKKKVEKEQIELPVPETIKEPALIKRPAEEAAKPVQKVKEKQPEPAAEPIEKVPEEEIKEETAVEKPVEEKRELKAKISKVSRLKGLITREIEIKENDLKDLLWELELSLLEADVEQTTAEEIARELKERLVGKKIGGKQNIDDVLKEEIKGTLASMMDIKGIDLLKEIKEKKEKPFKILFLGPNGAGKTTTMSKITHLLKEKGLGVIWSASDTFRAASIEQLEKHAENLGIRVVKHNYGSDPAAVAFDAIKAAQSKNIDVVMIDSAGRQETDKNLMQELQKIVRVAQPDLKIYVGEAFTGQALLHQAQEYDKMAGIDAFVLTKIDCDAKGGTVISLLYRIKKPVLFVGTGQGYKDLKKFEPEFILDRIIA